MSQVTVIAYGQHLDHTELGQQCNFKFHVMAILVTDIVGLQYYIYRLATLWACAGTIAVHVAVMVGF